MGTRPKTLRKLDALALVWWSEMSRHFSANINASVIFVVDACTNFVELCRIGMV